MNKKLATIKIILDTRNLMASNKHSIKLRITHNRIQKYYLTSYSLSSNDWDILNSENAKGALKKLKTNLYEIEKKAEEVINNIKDFTFNKFETQFFRTTSTSTLLKSMFDVHIKTLFENNQIGTSISYQSAFNSFNSFKENIDLFEITIDFLKKYEFWLLEKGKSVTTVGIYMRSLRTIINLAIEKGIFKKDEYPFGKRKYQIPTGKNIKKALSKSEVLKLHQLNCELKSVQDKARDFWIFSYLSNGINFTDIAHLKWEQINENSFWFYRQKTILTRKSNPLPIQVILNETSKNIIEKWGNKKTKYVFDIINEKDDSTRKKQKTQQFIKVTNKWLKRIGIELKLNQPLRTYSARHSYSSILIKEGNAPIELVSQNLGHSSILTTQKYFSGFEITEQTKYADALL